MSILIDDCGNSLSAKDISKMTAKIDPATGQVYLILNDETE